MGSMHWTDEESSFIKAMLTWEEPSEAEKAAQHAAYIAAAKKKSVGEFRILVIGPKGAGKTSILTRFCQDTFRGENEPADPFYERGCRHVVDIDGQFFMVDALEMPSKHLSSNPMLEQALNITEAAVLVYDVRDASSLRLAQSLAEFIRDSIGSREYGLVLVGNKTDVGDVDVDGDSDSDGGERQVSFADGSRAAGSLAVRCAFLEVSAKTGDGVAAVFPSVGREILRVKLLTRQRRDEADRAAAAARARAHLAASAQNSPTASSGNPLKRARGKLGLWKTLTMPFFKR